MSAAAAPLNRFMITFGVMAATVMQVLDMTIVNVALPDMMGSLSASTDQISWVLTTYLVASAVMMPLTGYMSDKLGRRRFLLLSIGGFVLASAMCGLAFNLSSILLFRIVQGIFGAALVPLSQAVMVDVFPLEERGKAMAIWGMGVMVGPILGPTLGGYLTEYFSWRWTFFINLPVGLLSFALAERYIPDTPRRERDMDWLGLFLASVAIACMQFVLDRGNQDGWMGSTTILSLTVLGVVSFIFFLVYALNTTRKPVFDVRMFKDKNFATGSFMILVMGLGLFGSMVIQPLYLEGLMGYPTLDTGLLMAPRGIASMFSMMLMGRLLGRVDTRLIVGAGILLTALGSHFMTYYNFNIDLFWIVWPAMVQGFGLGMIFVPISTVALSTLDTRLAAEGAGLFSLMRTLGSSVGISVATTLYTRGIQTDWNLLGGYIQPYNPQLRPYLETLHQAPDSPLGIQLLARELARQAQIVALTETFAIITLSVIAMLPLLFFLRGKLPRRGPPAASE